MRPLSETVSRTQGQVSEQKSTERSDKLYRFLDRLDRPKPKTSETVLSDEAYQRLCSMINAAAENGTLTPSAAQAIRDSIKRAVISAVAKDAGSTLVKGL
jgi:hypothetical protein